MSSAKLISNVEHEYSASIKQRSIKFSAFLSSSFFSLFINYGVLSLTMTSPCFIYFLWFNSAITCKIFLHCAQPRDSGCTIAGATELNCVTISTIPKERKSFQLFAKEIHSSPRTLGRNDNEPLIFACTRSSGMFFNSAVCAAKFFTSFRECHRCRQPAAFALPPV